MPFILYPFVTAYFPLSLEEEGFSIYALFNSSKPSMATFNSSSIMLIKSVSATPLALN